jgi:MarR family transcriptional regulator for hemolysin
MLDHLIKMTSQELALRHFGQLIAQTTRAWRRVIDQKLAPFGLSEALWLPLLYSSRASEPMQQKELAAALGLESSAVVRLLDNLQNQGLIERHEGADRRVKTIHLTPLGLTRVAQIEAIAKEVRHAIFQGLDPQEIEQACRVTEQVFSNLQILEQELS